MKNVLKELAKLTDDQLGLAPLGKKLREFDLQKALSKEMIPAIENSNNYARNILQLNPVEVVVLHWPPGVESAIHHHEGFWGYVYVAEGSCENVEYDFINDELRERAAQVGLPGALIKEKDGVIHKLRNPSKTKRAVTVHFYVPPLETFAGMQIFDEYQERIGILNNKAKTSSWEEPVAHFSSISENAFTYRSHQELTTASHHIGMVLPKPNQKKIGQMLTEYYNEQANEYDFFDLSHPSRKAYIATINNLIAKSIKENPPQKLLSIACGTGRRAKKIQALNGLKYEINGIDLSPEMLSHAQKRGIKTYCCDWQHAQLGQDRFDVVTYLYAFGHLSTKTIRLQSLKKVAEHLNSGGLFFVDLFNVDDKNEWGPKALQFYHEHQLYENGYEPGDVFYKKAGGKAYAYLHYFSEEEVKQLFSQAGLQVLSIKHIGYVKKPGEVLPSNDEGALFVTARKN